MLPDSFTIGMKNTEVINFLQRDTESLSMYLSKRAQLKQSRQSGDYLLTRPGNELVAKSELRAAQCGFWVFSRVEIQMGSLSLPFFSPFFSVFSLRSVTRSYYRNSVGGLLVFDLTNRASFDHIKEWHDEVCERVQPHKVLFVLVGQKSDRDAFEERVVSREEAEKLAAQLGLPYVEASAKTGQNVRESFELLTRRVYQGLLSGEVELQEGWDGVKCAAPQALQLQRASLAQPSPAPKNKKCCG